MEKGKLKMVDRFIRILFVTALFFCSIGMYAKQKVSDGKIVEYKDFKSKIIKARNVTVWLPNDYNEEQKYAVIYMHDGQMLFDANTTWNKQEWAVDEVATELIETNECEAFIVVGVDNISNDRYNDYFPQKTVDYLPKACKIYNDVKLNANNYLKFLTTELKPFIDKNYSTKKEVQNTFIMGSSMGGLISLYAICEYPEVYGGAAALSTHSPMISSRNLNSEQADTVSMAFRAYLKENLPLANSRYIYMDRGDVTLDSLYKPYQDKLDQLMIEDGWKAPYFTTKVFEGAAHQEIDWAKRLNIPILFLLNKGEE